MKYLKIYSLAAFIFILTACNPVMLDSDKPKSDEQLCSQVKKLLTQHNMGFSEIKGKLVATQYMDIWEAKYNLVGKDCQVWRWSNAKQAYMCSVNVPNEEMAIQKVNKAVSFTKQCLGNAWVLENIERTETGAYRSIFSNSGLDTVASIHRVKTEGLFKSEWTVYYFIGERDQSL